MRSLVVQFFFVFQDTYYCSIHLFYWVSDRCRSGFALWYFFIRKNCHKLVVSTSFCSWLLNVSSVSTSLKYAALLFWFLNALWVCWLHGTSGFWILVFVFLKYVFLVFVLDAILFGTNFFIFQGTLWLVKSSWCVHYYSINQFYWVSDRCRSGFSLW